MFKLTLASIFAWGTAGVFAVLGSIVGNAAGKSGLFAGAAVGGLVGVAAAGELAIKVGWLASVDRRGALVGGLTGFAIAAPIAATNLRTPVIPVLVCALAGIGLFVGVWVARGRLRRPS